MNKFIEINGVHFNLSHIISISESKNPRTGHTTLIIKFSNGEIEKIVHPQAKEIISKLNS
ncbi:hypothetical protein JI747_009135 [Chryseobacterium sp. RG1]|uniref:Uncharacterized protein n=1 Tax=Chryseobacterium tagetis TaxID=2801334 RepID=A0ABS8A1M4_9FLAO|nr:hypothetical protein [Chryseobacterium tagetis]MCA6067337.1 hypothetical protein [Chryseobacterium tagetis]